MRRPARNRREPFRIISRRRVYRGRVIELVRDEIEAGGRRMIRETIFHPGSVVIVPLLPGNRIVFVRQYRRAVGSELVELPAGTLGAREKRLRCAKRELEEETGWRGARWKRLGDFYPAPGFLAEQMTVFLATQLTPGPARPEPDERITPVVLSLAEAVRKIRAGSICDAKSMIGVWLLRDLLAARRRIV